VAILRDGQLVYMLERAQIEIRTAEEIAAELKAAFDAFCAKTPA
jgi:putative YphP/YqiW family bacilliredoxin